MRQPDIKRFGNVIPFRPVERRVSRRRKSTWVRWLKPFFGAVALISLPMVFIFWLLSTPQLALAELQIEHDAARIPGAGGPLDAAPKVSAAWAQRALQPFVGQNLLQLSLQQVDLRLGGHPWIAGLDLRKELPDRLSVRIIERRAAALVNHEQRLFYVDQDGQPISALHPLEPAPNLIMISRPDPKSASVSSALRLVERLQKLGLSWTEELSQVEIVGQDDFCVFSAQLPFALLLSTEGLEDKTRHLEELLPQIRSRYPAAATVDLRFSRRILIQPSIPELLRNRATWHVERS